MTDQSDLPQWIDVSRADDPRDIVHRAVACLAQGGVVGLAAETVYGAAASILRVEGLERVRAAREGEGEENERPIALMLKGPEELADWSPWPSPMGQRMAWRLWPGPATLVFSSSAAAEGLSRRLPASAWKLISPNGEVALCCPSNPVARDVLRLLPAPLAIAAPGPRSNRGAAAVPFTADGLRGLSGLDMVLDSGPTRYQDRATVVRINETERWSIVREGVVSAEMVARAACSIFLFVCTGNTCRSPMAEAICKLALARRLGCSPDELVKHGYLVLSAGVAATAGSPAAGHAVEVVRALGGSLEDHQSQPIAPRLARQSDYIFAMTADHLDALLNAVPDVEPHAYLLDPSGGDVADPVGADHETYRRTARAIEALIERRLNEMGIGGRR